MNQLYELTYVTNPIEDDALDAVLASGDVVLSCHGGLNFAAMDVEASTAGEAARRGAEWLSSLGVFVLRLDLDLVTQAEIAARAEVTPSAVSQWVNGKQDPNGFPTPYAWVRGGLWAWGDVLEWLRVQGRDGSGVLAPRPLEVEAFNVQWTPIRTQMFSRPLATQWKISIHAPESEVSWRASTRVGEVRPMTVSR